MAANRRSRKGRRISSKEFILSFFTFFFNSCFGCSRQPPPPEAEEEEEELNSTDKNTNVNAEKSADAVKYSMSRSTAPVPIISRSAPPCVVGSSKRRVNYDKKDFEKRTSGGDEINSIIGALIVSVTLVVMLIWGKLCAVICAALWLYFVPRFRAEDRNEFHEFDRMKIVSKTSEIIDSPEDKRRVVFEGFLERNHRVRI